LIFWERAAADGNISEEFQRVCGKNRMVVEAVDVGRRVNFS